MKLIGIQKLLFLIWVISLGIFTQFAFNPSDPTPAYIVVAVLAGASTFGLFWLISLFRLTKKPRLSAAQLPLLSIALTLLFVLGLSKVSAFQPKSHLIIAKQRRCYNSLYTWEMISEDSPCPVGTTSYKPTSSVLPSPSNAPKSASNHVKPTQQPKTEEGKCYDPEGNIIADEKCPWLSNTTTSQPAPQPTYNYYVPTYEPIDTSFDYDLPPMPTYEPYVPSYPEPNITSEPFPTLGPSYNPNEICQTYTTNAMGITVCK